MMGIFFLSFSNIIYIFADKNFRSFLSGSLAYSKTQATTTQLQFSNLKNLMKNSFCRFTLIDLFLINIAVFLKGIIIVINYSKLKRHEFQPSIFFLFKRVYLVCLIFNENFKMCVLYLSIRYSMLNVIIFYEAFKCRSLMALFHLINN